MASRVSRFVEASDGLDEGPGLAKVLSPIGLIGAGETVDAPRIHDLEGGLDVVGTQPACEDAGKPHRT